MRAISLTLAGLHSYRQEQTIDFARLSECGVFGIVGPTGAGKSTILDAMTLALYGNVVRASHNTQGILNHAEPAVAVSFIFQLGNTCYRVDRRYSRKTDDTVAHKHSRLLEKVGDEWIPRAEKDAEVTARVVELLGLGPKDFTRAVVLPQGRFAEFLSLRGAERREMLERILNLEEVGARLSERCRAYRIDRSAQMDKLAAEKQGLGDASAEQLEAARHQLAAAESRATTAGAELEIARARHDEWKKLAQDAERQRGIAAAQVQWAERAPAVSECRRELESARRAERCRASLEQARETEKAHGAALRQHEVASRAASQCQAAFDGADHAWRAARRMVEEQRPILEARAHELEQVLEWQSEADRLRKDVEQLAAELKTLAAERTAADAACRAASDQLRSQQDSILRNELAFAEAASASARQARVAEAFAALRARDKAAVEVDRCEAKLTQKRNERLRCTDLVTQASESQAAAAAEVDHANRELERLQQSLSQAATDSRDEDRLFAAWETESRQLALLDESARREQQALERLTADEAAARAEAAQARALVLSLSRSVEELKIRSQQAREAWEESRAANMASALAAALANGAPCPVCGSTEHPSPRHATDPSHEAALGAAFDLVQGELAEHQARLNDEKNRLARAETRLEAQLAALQTADTRRLQIEEAMDRARAAFPVAIRRADLPRLIDWVREQGRANEARQKEQEQLRAAAAAALERHRTAQTALAAAQVELGQAQAAVNSSEIAIGESEQELAMARQALDAACAELNRARGDLAIDQIAEEYEFVQKSHTRAQSLQEELSAARLAASKLQKDRDAAVEVLHQLDETIAERHARAGWIESQERNLRDKIAKVAPTGAPANLLEEIQRQRQGMDQRLKDCEQEREAANTERERAANALHAADQARAIAEAQACQALERITSDLEAAGFDSAELAAAALRSDEERERLAHEIDQFDQERTALEAEEEAIRARLAAADYSEEAWLEVQEQFAARDQAYKAALVERGTQQQVADDLERRHERWLELHAAEAALRPELDRVVRLEKALEGRAFIDYIARTQLARIARDASSRLLAISGRYALEADPDGGFLIRDDANGGVRRAISTLSGGETFLASLALALALSTHLQLRGRHPLELFFLDEGFGSLDAEKLEAVVTALERLATGRLVIGAITHVPELRARLPRQLIVEPATPGGDGTRVRIAHGC